MSNFRVFPIPNSVAKRIREVRVDDFGHQLSVSPATENDNGPCRSCLTVFLPGEGRILFSYAPNQHDHPYNEVGPIYIHEKECRPYTNQESFPTQLRTRKPLVLRCYADNGMMVGGELVGERPVEEVIAKLFEDAGVKYLHARTASVGCYIAQIERRQPEYDLTALHKKLPSNQDHGRSRRGSNNTKPGTDRGPQAGIPLGVVDATGSQINFVSA